jgi:hypothetical protein
VVVWCGVWFSCSAGGGIAAGDPQRSNLTRTRLVPACLPACLPDKNSVTAEQRVELASVYDALETRLGEYNSMQRIRLELLACAGGDASKFQLAVDEYLRRGLRRGVPSLFSTLRPVYKRALRAEDNEGPFFARRNAATPGQTAEARARVAAIGELCKGYLDRLRADGCMLPVRVGENRPAVKDAPTVLLWTLYFYAQHLDMLGDHVRVGARGRAWAPAWRAPRSDAGAGLGGLAAGWLRVKRQSQRTSQT